MEKLENLTDDQKKYAIDLMTTLVVEEIAEKLRIDQAKILHDFVSSETGKLLYDESSKLWWNGPSYIAEMYMKEKKRI